MQNFGQNNLLHLKLQFIQEETSHMIIDQSWFSWFQLELLTDNLKDHADKFVEC